MQRQPLHRTLWLSFAGTGSGGLRDTTSTALVGVGTWSPGGENVLRLDLKSIQRPVRLGLLPGGGFETPGGLRRGKARALYARNHELGPWRITAGSVNVQRYWPVAEGRQTVDLNGVTPGTIEQTFATIPGQVYQLLFDYANNPDARGRTATATVTVSGVSKLLSTGDRSCGLDAEGHEVQALPGCLHRRFGDHRAAIRLEHAGRLWDHPGRGVGDGRAGVSVATEERLEPRSRRTEGRR